jgi:hypothetical protein
MRSDTAAVIRQVLNDSPREHITADEVRELAAAWEACREVIPDGRDDPRLANFRRLYRGLMELPFGRVPSAPDFQEVES